MRDERDDTAGAAPGTPTSLHRTGSTGDPLNYTDWLAIAALCASGAVTPGPSLAVVLKNTVHGGSAAGVATAVAHGAGVGLYAFAAVAGFAVVVQTVPGIAIVLELLGACFLIRMGLSTGLATPTRTVHSPSTAAVRDGFAIAFFNPKIAVFFLALLSTFVPAEAPLTTKVGVAVLAMAIDAGWYAFVALVLHASGGAAWLARRQRAVQIVTAALLLVIGLAMLTNAVFIG